MGLLVEGGNDRYKKAGDFLERELSSNRDPKYYWIFRHFVPKYCRNFKMKFRRNFGKEISPKFRDEI